MGERITGGTARAEQRSLGESMREGANRLVDLGQGIAHLESQDFQLVTVRLTDCETPVLVARTKLLALLMEEREEVGKRMARILTTLYGAER